MLSLLVILLANKLCIIKKMISIIQIDKLVAEQTQQKIMTRFIVKLSGRGQQYFNRFALQFIHVVYKSNLFINCIGKRNALKMMMFYVSSSENNNKDK